MLFRANKPSFEKSLITSGIMNIYNLKLGQESKWRRIAWPTNLKAEFMVNVIIMESIDLKHPSACAIDSADSKRRADELERSRATEMQNSIAHSESRQILLEDVISKWIGN